MFLSLWRTIHLRHQILAVNRKGNLALYHIMRNNLMALVHAKAFKYDLTWSTNSDYLSFLISRNYTEMVKMLIASKKIVVSKKTFETTAAYSQDPELFKWLWDNYPKLRPDIITQRTTFIKYGIHGGNLKVVKHLFSLGFRVDKSAIELAASFGHVSILKWMRDSANGSTFPLEMVWRYGIAYYQLATMAWAFPNVHDPEIEDEEIHQIIRHGHLDIIKWAFKNGICPRFWFVFGMAEKYRQTAIMKWAWTQLSEYKQPNVSDKVNWY